MNQDISSASNISPRCIWIPLPQILRKTFDSFADYLKTPKDGILLLHINREGLESDFGWQFGKTRTYRWS